MSVPNVPTTNASGKQAYQRISKACQQCRRRKIKCDGAAKCNNCEQISGICNYRSTTRLRKSTKRAVAQQQQQPSSLIENQPNSDTPLASLEHQQHSPLSNSELSYERLQTVQEHNLGFQFSAFQNQDDQSATAGINRSIAATHITSASCILQLYYGASSNFSFLQQVDHSLYGAANPPRPCNEVEEGGARLDLYGQRSLFFGTPDDNFQSNGFAGISPLTFLSDQLAESFLQDYLKTIYNLHPFQPSQELHRLLKLSYEKPQTGNLTTDETAILMAVLAIGATMTKNTSWAEMLAEKAKNSANALGHIVNLQAVQLSLLLISVRKAFAAGLHRETPGYSADGRKHVQQQERRTTIWCLYFYETLICFALGRPSSISRVDISIPYPENQSFISALVKLTNVMSEAAGSIYAHRQSSLQNLYRKAQKIHQGLRDYASDIQESLGINLSQSSVSSELNIKHIFLQNLYHHILALTFRPFMIADVDHQKLTASAGNTSASRSQNGRPIAETFPWMPEACRCAVDAAFNLIRFISIAVKQNVVTRGLRFFSFYIEGACFLLIYDVLRDSAAKNRNISAVKMGLQCLSSMVPGGRMITSNIFSIQRLLDALDEMSLRTGPQVNDSASAGSGQTSFLSRNFDFISAAEDESLNESVAASCSFDTLVNFAAGWATFEDGHYMNQNAVHEPEHLNPDIFNINWEFDNV
ncbi:hypothetical protein BCON_0460g00010 [Botryotinia convoluta]|uniref:Zn(2)-C6 fungal-type domain-containing protein n=1 Tax=Botryotinia convoluta TaxID=54673 RepID=A0A4Z1HIF5_9HELO|nr:hypothetical protein BCON_0460g00010 [Botryotinia convoluta]